MTSQFTFQNQVERLRRELGEIGELLARHDGRRGAADGFERYADDPAGFARDVLGWTPWSRQVDIMEAVRDHPYVVVRSCVGAGKDAAAARLALWWVYARGGLALVTGPKEGQVKSIVMGEVRAAFERSPDLPGDLFELELRVDRATKTGILAFTADKVSRLTGFHAPRVLFIITEAQGVEPFVFEAAISCTTGEGSKILAVGNPLFASGPFYQACRRGHWHQIKIPAEECPNVRAGREVIPGGMDRRTMETFRNEYGEGSPVYQARVLAEFPENSEHGLCQRSWIRAANERWTAGALDGAAAAAPVLFALDPARYGPDSTMLAIRQGPVIRELVSWSRTELMETTGRVIEELDKRQLLDEGPDGTKRARARLVVDETGVGGGVVDRLREQGLAVDGFNGGYGARNTKKYANARAEAYWQLRRLLEDGKIALPPDPLLEEELVETRWKPNSAGKIIIEPKDNLKPRIGRSPDRADAVAMAFYFGAMRTAEVVAAVSIPKTSPWRSSAEHSRRGYRL